MAENKRSVLLYCDIIHTVEELDDVDAGLLFKHYLRYINDQNPEPPSKLIKIVFEPIKQNLKRDLRKWEEKSVKNSENARIRWDKNNANASERIERNANNADKDTVTVIDTVNDNVTNKKILSTTVDHEFEISILEIIRSIKSGHTGTDHKPYKLTPKRIRMVVNRNKDFNKLWPSRDFHKACTYAFRYKAKEWFGTDMFRHFEPETLLSEKFVSYLEKAEQDKGEPYKADKKPKEESEKYRITPNSYQNG